MAVLLTEPDVEPILPGSTFYFEAERPVSVPASIGSTVLVPGTADWGPDNEARFITSYRRFLDVFGKSDTALRRRVFHALLGEGLPGKGGAGSVIVYRQATPAAARATLTLQNTEGVPVNAVTFTAFYKGTRGNTIRVEIRASATAGEDEAVIYDDTRVAEVYQYPQANLAQLVADVNASSSLVTATLLKDGFALADRAATALAGGNDGAALTATEWTNMLTALEFEPFSVFCAAGLTDPVIVASLLAWKDDVASRGKPLFVGIGGPLAEAFSAHKSRAQGYGDPDILAFGTGDIVDSTLNADGTEQTISTAEGIARVCGAIARRGELLDMVNVRFAGWRVAGGATGAQAEIAASSGMTVLTRDGDREAPTKIPLGVTSYIGDTDDRPRFVYSNVKFVRTNHGLQSDLTEDQEHGDLIGELGVTPRAADTILGRAKAIIKRRIEREIVQAGSDVVFDPSVPRSEGDDFVALAFDVIYVRGLRSIRNRIRLS